MAGKICTIFEIHHFDVLIFEGIFNLEATQFVSVDIFGGIMERRGSERKVRATQQLSPYTYTTTHIHSH